MVKTTATVVTIKEYGAFVDIAQGVSGLVHVSEFSDERVNDPNEYVAEGDVISVRVLEIDRMGRVKLSAKAVSPIKKSLSRLKRRILNESKIKFLSL